MGTKQSIGGGGEDIASPRQITSWDKFLEISI
jgi:hypothetical protein